MSNMYADFLLKSSLYSKVEIKEETEEEWLELLKGAVKLNCYCPNCEETRVFILDPPKVFYHDANDEFMRLADYLVMQKQKFNLANMPQPGAKVKQIKWFWRLDCDADTTRIIELPFRCAMDGQHRLDYILIAGDDYVKKVGQSPSLADLSLNEINRYRKVTGDQTIKELKRAIGLNAQGIGIGSYVYLRRVFERIIDQAKKQSIERGELVENDFANKRIDEQIKLLTNDLPDALIDNKMFYKIVSKGIHELSEEECNNYFPILKDAIVLIWNEWQSKKEKQDALAALNKSLNKISSEL